jgi:hypothetical protein
MPEWKPPAKLKPITVEAYAGLAQFIDAGTKMFLFYEKRLAEGCTSQCLPKSTPPVSEMAAELYKYIPAATIPLAEGLDDSDRTSIETFRAGRKVLLQALDDATPLDVLEQLQDADPEGEGLTWWAVALAAGGVLAWLGRRSWRGAILARIGAVLLAGLAAAGVITDLTEGAKQLLQKPLEQTVSLLPILAGGAGAVALVALLLKLRSPSPTPGVP